MKDCNIGSFVQFDRRLCSIIAMTDDIAKLSNGQEIACDQLNPIEIGESLDKQITLVCDNIRYLPGEVKMESNKYYQDCFLLQGKTIKDVLKENPSIKYLHELQNWLMNNTEGFRLVCMIGFLKNE